MAKTEAVSRGSHFEIYIYIQSEINSLHVWIVIINRYSLSSQGKSSHSTNSVYVTQFESKNEIVTVIIIIYKSHDR